ncbi:MAG TPA: hypothetical protein VIW73_03815 [Candidatus Cybelea sp.]
MIYFVVMRPDVRHDRLPGAELVADGLTDLAAGKESVLSLLVSIGAPKLRACGIDVPAAMDEPNLRLYRLLQREHGDAAHSRYNALIRRLVSYERALQCARIADRDRIERFMQALSGYAREPTRLYFAGGATAVLHGWRSTTIDVDIKIAPDRDDLMRAIPRLRAGALKN